MLSVLSSAVADKLVGSVTLLKESFVGTLERCLTTLEGTTCVNGNGLGEDTTNNLQASHALRQILNAAYQVLLTVNSSYVSQFMGVHTASSQLNSIIRMRVMC